MATDGPPGQEGPASLTSRSTTARPGPAADLATVEWLLRAGLAFVFAYAALSTVLRPEAFHQYLPPVLPETWSHRLLPWFAAYELLLVAGLLGCRRVGPPALTAAATLVAIVAANPGRFDVLFRNVAIALSALALAVLAVRRPAAAASSVQGSPVQDSPVQDSSAVAGRRARLAADRR